MKKIVSLLLCAAMLVPMAACGNGQAGTEASSVSSTAPTTESTAETESNSETSETASVMSESASAPEGEDVTLTIPASLLEGSDLDSMVAQAQEQGAQVTKNEDGSLTYTMSAADHAKMIEEMRGVIQDSFSTLADGESFPSIKKITANDDLTEFTLTVSRAQYEVGTDTMAVVSLAISSALFQMFSGKDENEYEIIFHLEDKDTGEIYETFTYPEDTASSAS